MPNALVPYALALLAGASIVVQQVMNASLRERLASALWAAVASYAGGLAFVVLLALVLRAPPPATSLLARAPWWTWSGGVFGAIYIALAIVLVPRLGAATFVGLLVTGQMLAAVAVDQVGWLGLAQRPLDAPRALGIALLVGGVLLVRR